MNLFDEREKLKTLIKKYLVGQVALKELEKFAWTIIDSFNSMKKSQLPDRQQFEREFWYVIWQIQHLADEEHEQEGLTRSMLINALAYLEGTERLPDNFFGNRPDTDHSNTPRM